MMFRGERILSVTGGFGDDVDIQMRSEYLFSLIMPNRRLTTWSFSFQVHPQERRQARSICITNHTCHNHDTRRN